MSDSDRDRRRKTKKERARVFARPARRKTSEADDKSMKDESESGRLLLRPGLEFC